SCQQAYLERVYLPTGVHASHRAHTPHMSASKASGSGGTEGVEVTATAAPTGAGGTQQESAGGTQQESLACKAASHGQAAASGPPPFAPPPAPPSAKALQERGLGTADGGGPPRSRCVSDEVLFRRCWVDNVVRSTHFAGSATRTRRRLSGGSPSTEGEGAAATQAAAAAARRQVTLLGALSRAVNCAKLQVARLNFRPTSVAAAQCCC
ncbi:unnamed protein product, partial [Effrenium voratum]